MSEEARQTAPWRPPRSGIFELIREIASGLKVDLTPVIFKWDSDEKLSQVLLLVYNGKKRYVVHLEERDVEDWRTTPEFAGKYVRKMINIMECVMRSP